MIIPLDTIQFIKQDTTISIPLKWDEKQPPKPIQYGIVGTWLTGLILVIFILKHPQ